METAENDLGLLHMFSCSSVHVSVQMETQWGRIASSFDHQQSSCAFSGVKGPHHDHLMVLSFFLPPPIRWHLENREVTGTRWTGDDGRRVSAAISHSCLQLPPRVRDSCVLNPSTLLEQLCFSSAKTFAFTYRGPGQLHERVCMILSASAPELSLSSAEHRTQGITLFMGKFCCFSL